MLLEKQNISRKLETHRCPGCLLNLALSMLPKAISDVKSRAGIPAHSCTFSSSSFFHRDANRISEQTDFLMRSLALSFGCEEFQAAEWLSGMQVPQPTASSPWVCGLCLHCFSPWGLYLCDMVCSGPFISSISRVCTGAE